MGDALELGASYLEQTFRQPTTAETKIEISRKISKLGISFLVILDDLDRFGASPSCRNRPIGPFGSGFSQRSRI